jgi:hypothetical protein
MLVDASFLNQPNLDALSEALARHCDNPIIEQIREGLIRKDTSIQIDLDRTQATIIGAIKALEDAGKRCVAITANRAMACCVETIIAITEEAKRLLMDKRLPGQSLH